MLQHLTSDTWAQVAEQLVDDKQSLLTLLLVSKEFHLLVLPILYYSVTILERTVALQFCRAVEMHPQAPGRFVLDLCIQSSSRHMSPLLDDGDLRTIRKALVMMPNLRVLSLLGADVSAVLAEPNLTFSLDSLYISPPIDASVVQFLRMQMLISELHLCFHVIISESGCFNPPDFSGTDLLPNLTTLVCCPKLFATLAPGRPITHAAIHACCQHRMIATDLVDVVSALNQTSRPITSLSVYMDSDPDIDSWEFIEALRGTRVCSTLVRLTLDNALINFVRKQVEDASYLSSLASLLREFGYLRYFEIEAPADANFEDPTQPPGVEVISMIFNSLGPAVGLDRLWRSTCPSLVGVCLFGLRIT